MYDSDTGTQVYNGIHLSVICLILQITSVHEMWKQKKIMSYLLSGMLI